MNVRAVGSRLREAYRNGATGEVDRTKGRLQRLAYLVGKRGLNAVEQSQEASRNYNTRMLTQAIEVAQGTNKAALRVIETAAQIRHQSVSDPTSPQRMHYPEEGNRMTIGWNTRLHYGVSRDPSREESMTPLSQSLGVLTIDSLEWSHNGLTIAVDNVSINTVSSLEGVYGQELVGPACTTLFINTREYDPKDLKLSHSSSFTGGAKIELNEAGEVVYLGVTQENSTGYVDQPVDGVQINLDAFLEGVRSAAQATVDEYARIAESMR